MSAPYMFDHISDLLSHHGWSEKSENSAGPFDSHWLQVRFAKASGSQDDKGECLVVNRYSSSINKATLVLRAASRNKMSSIPKYVATQSAIRCGCQEYGVLNVIISIEDGVHEGFQIFL
ncbi:hypothetical protein H112_06948 [Trichophyton rubrum D6]|uniref:Uncharacterized protein n=1 Tax=Trichophyton rubrum (strain ATCC MYA-4607 / CBS 118892) TaxID=559305 RepID=A0A080WF36_TRIRC|nr:uncharacterized protein TERG_11831 [Trichophyton rubrum CBS 118892]EZF60202.1 hypothetical protein H104_06911 [Trichophyton rubrum CBS 289.86]KDB30648.1 hypothetical protein H112_06948 [Trichophyton rubrum D6]KFL60836.1 hypothetical protein TERG_11831 [Trichophyton rubrum CBS 118892]